MTTLKQISTVIIRRYDKGMHSYVLLQHKDVRFWHRLPKLSEFLHVGDLLSISLDRCNENDEGQERFGNQACNDVPFFD
jgi:hypothetical protein